MIKRVVKNKEKNCKSFGNGRKVMKLWVITRQFQLKKQNKQTNKQNNLLTLTISCEKRSCLIRSKKKKTKPNQKNNNNNNNNKKKKREKKKRLKN